MKQLWNDLLQRRHVVEALGAGFELEDRHTAWPIPAGIDRATLTSGRVCFVGDAAMAADTMTGEGIGQALLTARLAAEAIIHEGGPEAVAGRYRSTVREHLVADHKMSVLLSKVLSHQLGTRGAIRTAGLQRLVAPQLRPVDVRGRTAGHRLHPLTLAPPPLPSTRPFQPDRA